MSCNITSGISTGCNDQVGGITGIHYTTWYDDLVFEKDANGVIVRVYRALSPTFNLPWYWVEADNSMGNLTETYNVGGTGNILGFNQSLKFFIPTTATPSIYNNTQSLQNWVAAQAAQNNMLIGIELDHHTPTRSYAGKAFIIGQQRPAFTNSGNKQTGVAYGDDNGYNIEWMADSKEPMNELAYMAMHSWTGLVVKKALDPNYPQYDTFWSNVDFFNLEPLVSLEGANIKELFTGIYSELWVMPGELLTVEAQITIDWGANAFSGTTFLPQWQISEIVDGIGVPLNYVGNVPTTPGIFTVRVKGTYENTNSIPKSVYPINMQAPLAVNVSGGAIVPSARFITITRTT